MLLSVLLCIVYGRVGHSGASRSGTGPGSRFSHSLSGDSAQALDTRIHLRSPPRAGVVCVAHGPRVPFPISIRWRKAPPRSSFFANPLTNTESGTGTAAHFPVKGFEKWTRARRVHALYHSANPHKALDGDCASGYPARARTCQGTATLKNSLKPPCHAHVNPRATANFASRPSVHPLVSGSVSRQVVRLVSADWASSIHCRCCKASGSMPRASRSF